MENNPIWWPKVVSRITVFRLAKDELAVGDLSRAERLVVPFKNGDAGLESRYRAFLSDPDFKHAQSKNGYSHCVGPRDCFWGLGMLIS